MSQYHVRGVAPTYYIINTETKQFISCWSTRKEAEQVIADWTRHAKKMAHSAKLHSVTKINLGKF